MNNSNFFHRQLQRLTSKIGQPQDQKNQENKMANKGSEYVKIYGERNSGTHFVHRLIRNNFHCQFVPGTLADATPGYREAFEDELARTVTDDAKRLWLRQVRMDEYFESNAWSTLGWKHAVPPLNTILGSPNVDCTLFVTVVKNPYSWALSLFRRPYEVIAINKPTSLKEFLNEVWPTVRRDNAPSILKSPIELWNYKTASYHELAKHTNTVNLRYEDTLADPLNSVNVLSDFLDRRSRDPVIESESAKEVDRGNKDLNYYRDYYLSERWRSDLTEADIALINEYLDPTTVRLAGYEMIDPHNF